MNARILHDRVNVFACNNSVAALGLHHYILFTLLSMLYYAISIDPILLAFLPKWCTLQVRDGPILLPVCQQPSLQEPASMGGVWRRGRFQRNLDFLPDAGFLYVRAPHHGREFCCMAVMVATIARCNVPKPVLTSWNRVHIE